MSEHTKEPWEVHPDAAGVVVAASDPDMSLLGLDIDRMASFMNEHDARRIVACVNACAGIDTDFLERTHAKGYASGFRKHIELETECEELRNRLAAFENGTASDCARASIKAANKLLSQRATLLAALNLINTDKDGDGFVCKEAMNQIREAIAIAEEE